ncbi:MAG TPA: VOC family protein [Gemmatimonadaceae bacterium]|nr:VOC family protein [Gemmatimonadaceae bacterium]
MTRAKTTTPDSSAQARFVVSRNRSMPPSVVIPVLGYPDVPAAVEWLCRVFGFAERLRIADHRAQLSVGTGDVVVAGRHPGVDAGAAHSVMVRVADVHAHHARAKAAGARILAPPTDYPYGERQYSAEDLGGHCWTFSHSIADVDPATWGGTLLG